MNYRAGLANKQRLKRLSKAGIAQAQSQFEVQQPKPRLFTGFQYKAGAWKRRRRVILKAEHMSQGSKPR